MGGDAGEDPAPGAAVVDAGEEPDVEAEEVGDGREHGRGPGLERAVGGRHVEEPVEPGGLLGEPRLGLAEGGDVDGHARRPGHMAVGVERRGRPRLVMEAADLGGPRLLLPAQHAPERGGRDGHVGVRLEHVPPDHLARRDPERLQAVPLREREHTVGVEGVEDDRGLADDGPEVPVLVGQRLGPRAAVEGATDPRREHAHEVVVGVGERGGERGGRREAQGPPRLAADVDRHAHVRLDPERLVARVPAVGRDGDVVDLEQVAALDGDRAERVTEREAVARPHVGPVARDDRVVVARDPAHDPDVEPEQRRRERERLGHLVLEREVALGGHGRQQPEPVGVGRVVAADPAPPVPDVPGHAAPALVPEREPQRPAVGRTDADGDLADLAVADAVEEGLGRRSVLGGHPVGERPARGVLGREPYEGGGGGGGDDAVVGVDLERGGGVGHRGRGGAPAPSARSVPVAAPPRSRRVRAGRGGAALRNRPP